MHSDNQYISGSLPLNDPGTLLERQARNRQKWQNVLAAKEENMHRKQADMKAMLAKGFKKEKAIQKQQEDEKMERAYKMDDKHEHYNQVAERKKNQD